MKKLLIFMAILWPAVAFADIAEIPASKQDMFNEITSGMACLCGCGTTIKTCPHENCGFAIPVKNEVESLILKGLSKKEIIAKIVSTRGEEILAAPTFTGFNLMAWVMPFVVILMVGFAIFYLIKNWASRRTITATNGTSPKKAEKAEENDPYLKKLRDELGNFDE